MPLFTPKSCWFGLLFESSQEFLTMVADNSDEALDKAFASIVFDGSGTLSAYELQVFIKRSFSHSRSSSSIKEMMDAADESENGAPLPATLDMRPRGPQAYALSPR